MAKRRKEKYIPGIYNYCDRWCERCPFTARCRNFAMEQAMNRYMARRDAENAAFWAAMEKAAGDALEDLIEQESTLAPKSNSFLDSANDNAEGEGDPLFEKDEKDPLVVEAIAYGNAADRWMERRRDVFRDGVDQLEPIVRDASDVVRWYCLLIGVKLNRAFFARRQERDEKEDGDESWRGAAPMPSDADGSAKVAIIAIDRSITAWAVLIDRRPKDATSIRPLVQRLMKLRGWVDREFPNARAFVRPGFDDGTAL